MIPLSDLLDICREDEGYREDYLICLYQHAIKLPPYSILVEIGCYRGLSTLMLAAAVKDKNSLICTIDPIFRTGELTYPNIEDNQSMTLQSSLEEVKKWWKSALGEPPIIIMADYSWDVLRRWMIPIDFLLIDGEHTKSAVMRDMAWSKFIKPGCDILLDDWFDKVQDGAREYLLSHPELTIIHESTAPPEGDMLLTLIRKHEGTL